MDEDSNSQNGGNILKADVLDGTNGEGTGSSQILSTGDLFSAHDFDIKLDLDAKLPRKCARVR